MKKYTKFVDFFKKSRQQYYSEGSFFKVGGHRQFEVGGKSRLPPTMRSQLFSRVLTQSIQKLRLLYISIIPIEIRDHFGIW